MNVSESMKKVVTDTEVIEVTTKVVVYPKKVKFSEILESCKVEQDEDRYGDTPWDNCDGWEHEFVSWRDLADVVPREELKNAEGFVWSEGKSCWGLIRLRNPENWGNYKFFHALGYSKQVAREMTARVWKKAIQQLVKWYKEGWDWWAVDCEFRGYSESSGGIDDYDHAVKWVCPEVAGRIAAQMQADGYEVVGIPKDKESTEKDRYLAKKARCMDMSV